MTQRRADEEAKAIRNRITARRMALGLSIRNAALRANISHTTWSRIERGEVGADNRWTLERMADALRCTLSDLTGLPPSPVARDQAETGGAVVEAARAVTEADLRYRPDGGRDVPFAALLAELDAVCTRVGACDYAAAMRRAPTLVAGLHQAAFGPDHRRALRALVICHESLATAARYLGHPGTACMIAERAQQAADASEDPVMIALGGWSRAQAALGLGLSSHGRTVASRAGDDLAAHVSQPQAPELLGMLRLTHSYAARGTGAVDESDTVLADAAELAQRTGETTTFQLMFGPTNVEFWRIAMLADGDAPGRALEVSRRVDPRSMPKVSRQAAYYLDVARAAAREGHDETAVRLLSTVERLAPQRMLDPLVVETVAALMRRARRRAGGPELRRLCGRLGVAL